MDDTQFIFAFRTTISNSFFEMPQSSANNLCPHQISRRVHLELPCCLPENLDLSQCVVLIGETRESARGYMVNAVDGCLYHVVNKSRKKGQTPFQGRNGYAAIGGRVYFVGGCYYDHDKEFSYGEALSEIREGCGLDDFDDCDDEDLSGKVLAKAAEIQARHLEVDCFNIRTKGWEFDVPKLNGPKPTPVVFVHDKKIYVVTGPAEGGSTIGFAPFECLDPLSDSGLTWTRLPDPPFPCACYMVDSDKGTFLVIKYSKETGGDDPMLHEFDLTSHKWTTNYSRPPKFFFDKINMSGISPEIFDGCSLGDFLFCYDDLYTPGIPLIVVYDVSGKGVEHVVNCTIDLALKGYVYLYPSNGYLNHLGGLKFSLVIFYTIQTLPSASAACTLTFQLQNTSAARREVTNARKPRKIVKPSFVLRDSHCRTFQLPMGVQFSFCKKME